MNRLCSTRSRFRGLLEVDIMFPIKPTENDGQVPWPQLKNILSHNVTELTYICQEKEQEKYCCNTSN